MSRFLAANAVLTDLGDGSGGGGSGSGSGDGNARFGASPLQRGRLDLWLRFRLLRLHDNGGLSKKVVSWELWQREESQKRETNPLFQLRNTSREEASNTTHGNSDFFQLILRCS